MLEKFRQITGSSEIYRLAKFAPSEELERILNKAPSERVGTYLNQEFRQINKQYGVEIDIPWPLRPIRKTFRKIQQRRSGIMIASSDYSARILVIDTVSPISPIRRGDGLSTDPETADLLVWPMLMRKKNRSNKPWSVYIEDEPVPQKVDFMIYLSKIGSKGFYDIGIRNVDPYYGVTWVHDNTVNPVDLLNTWAGLK